MKQISCRERPTNSCKNLNKNKFSKQLILILKLSIWEIVKTTETVICHNKMIKFRQAHSSPRTLPSAPSLSLITIGLSAVWIWSPLDRKTKKLIQRATITIIQQVSATQIRHRSSMLQMKTAWWSCVWIITMPIASRFDANSNTV